MLIPSSMQIGTRVYRVLWVDGFPENRLLVGTCSPSRCEITMSRTWDGAPTPPEVLHRKFWHEVFHAILYEIGRRNWDDCVYVEQLAAALSGAINTARFHDGEA